jgi:enoyl-CoA hydratase/carnithine racemase
MENLINEPELLSRIDNGVATLTLNRPSARNALSFSLMGELLEEILHLDQDSAAKVLVIAGNGPAFCAGHDLRELRAAPTRDRYEQVFERCAALMLAITHCSKPVIARVQGVATAAGCQLVATCDLAIAESGARFATPGVNIGLFCSTPMVALTRAVGRKPAMEMLLTGDLVDAEEARRIGLINRVVPAAQLDAEVAKLAGQIAGKSPLTLAIGKETFYRQAELDLEEAYRHAAGVMVRNMMAADAAEGIDAFLEKRKPEWRGC